jgi:repressor LexA
MTSYALDGRRSLVFHFVKEYLADNGYPPTVREIAQGVGLSSTGTTQMHLNTLRKMGLLEGEGRTLRPVKAA